MLVLPVLDLLNGRIVRGIAGRRETYRPIQSKLTRATDPLSVARVFRRRLGLTTLYLADLDAIAGHPPARAVYQSLQQEGFRLWLDCGLRDLRLASTLKEVDVDTVIVGLETLPGTGFLEQLKDVIEPGRLVVSLDMKEGRPITAIDVWRERTADDVAEKIIALGFARLILLDLAAVGMNHGPASEDLARRLLSRHGPKLSLILGGGIRGREDLLRLKDMGAEAALVASALHDRRIGRDDLSLLDQRRRAGEERDAFG